MQQLLLMLCILKKIKKIYFAYVSKHNSNPEKHYSLFIILLIIQNVKGREAKSKGKMVLSCGKKTISFTKRNNFTE